MLRDEALLAAKLIEEAAELASAEDRDSVVAEAADLAYFLMVKLEQAGVGLDEVDRELDRRELRQTRRPMLAKEDI